MREFRAHDFETTHQYAQHTSTINLDQEKVNIRHAKALQETPLPCPAPRQLGEAKTQSSPLFAQTVLPNIPLQWYPLYLPVRTDKVQPSSALPSPRPTAVVSPHCNSPPSEWESTRTEAQKPVNGLTKARANLDGHTSVQNGVHRSAPSITSNGVPNMGGQRDDRIPVPRMQRPSIVSQHSNSVPSTPLQLARQYESRSRSPSPSGGLGSHSPRSVTSEANGPLATLRPPRPHHCKYETNAAFGRRRILYVSSDILEKAKEEPKKTLDPDEDKKLSGDMRELYDRLLPDQDSKDRRKNFVKKLERILHTEWPGTEFTVHVFGSSGNELFTTESDGKEDTLTRWYRSDSRLQLTYASKRP